MSAQLLAALQSQLWRRRRQVCRCGVSCSDDPADFNRGPPTLLQLSSADAAVSPSGGSSAPSSAAAAAAPSAAAPASPAPLPCTNEHAGQVASPHSMNVMQLWVQGSLCQSMRQPTVVLCIDDRQHLRYAYTTNMHRNLMRSVAEGSVPAKGAGRQQELGRGEVRHVKAAAATVLRFTAEGVNALSQVQVGARCRMFNSNQVVLH